MTEVPGPPNGADTDSRSASFLLAEFSKLSQDWRHTDSRIEHALGLYLTVCTILASGTVAFIHFGRNPVQKLTGISIVAIPLAVAGIFLARRVVGADIVKAEYAKALSLIKRYFADNDPEIAPYLYLPESPTGLSREQIRDMRPSVNHSLVRLFHLWSSLLLGVGVALPLKIFAWELPVLNVVVIGIAVIVGCLVVLSRRLPLWENQMAKSVTIDWSGLSRHAGSAQADGEEQEETGT